MQKRRFAVILLAAMFAALGAGLQPNAFAQSAPATIKKPASGCAVRLGNLGQLKQQIKRYYACTCDCGCYEKETAAAGARATRFLRSRVAKAAKSEKLAMVLDIDDTALSNYPLYSTNDFSYVPAEYDRWLDGATAPPVKATLALFQAARQLGVAVFFISGRREDQRAATERNLSEAGFNGWSGVILRTPADKGKPASQFKPAARQQLVSQGYRLVLNVGDQLSDLAGKPAAERSVKLPNPMYFLP